MRAAQRSPVAVTRAAKGSCRCTATPCSPCSPRS